MTETSFSSEDPFGQIADEFVEAFRQGKRPSVEEFARRYPEQADEIREMLPALVLMEKARSAEDEQGQRRQSRASVAVAPLQQLGDYQILREVGRGGMGVVYEAQQLSLGRHVALKLLPSHALLDPRQLARFQREARSAAKLHHTNIVPVFGVGEQDGLHYFVMQFIHGLGLDAVLDELRRLRLPRGSQSLTQGEAPSGPANVKPNVSAADVAHGLLTGEFRQPQPDSALVTAPGVPAAGAPAPPVRATDASATIHLPGQSDGSTLSDSGRPYWLSVARIGMQVADALAHAASQGVLHRDVKPSNLLLDETGNVWVTDFGLAKAAGDGDDLTHTGDVVGTLRYMAPERFNGQGDVRSDTYSLGLTLYEMLTLRTAFDESDRNKLVRQVMHDEPPRPRKLNPAVPRDLETVVLKAIARDPAQRYQSPAEMAEDLKRFVEDLPVRARRVSETEKLWRWCRRNPLVAASLAGVVGIFLTAFVLVSLSYVRPEDARKEEAGQRRAADEARVDAQQKEKAERWERYRVIISAAASAHQLNNVSAVRRSLDDAPAEHRGWEWRHFDSQTDDAQFVLRGHQGSVDVVAFSPDGRLVASIGNGDGTLRLWETATGKEQRILRSERGISPTFGAIAFSADGTRIASGSDRGAVVWDVATGKEMTSLDNKESQVGVFPLSTAGIAAQMRGNASLCIRWLDMATGKEVARCEHDAGIINVAISRDGRRIATAGGGAIRVRDAQSGALVATLRGDEAFGSSVAFSPDGKYLVSGSNYPDSSLRLWKLAENPAEPVAVMRGHGNSTRAVFSPDGTRIASSSMDQTVRLWDGMTGKPVAVMKGHSSEVSQIAFSPDGKLLVSASRDRTLRLWEAATGNILAVLRGHTQDVESVAFSPDGALLASASHDGTVRLWDVARVTRRGVLRGHSSFVYDVAFSPDGTRVASAAWDGTVPLWDPTTGRQTALLRQEAPMVVSVAFASSGNELAVLARDDAVHWWDLRTEKRVRKLSVPTSQYQNPRLAVSSNGDLVAAGSHDGRVRIWQAATGEPVAVLSGHDARVRDVAFDPAGRRLASAGGDTIRVWDVAKKESIHVLRGHTSETYAVAFSGDGTLIASGSTDGTARLWDAATFEPIAVLKHGGNVYKVAFSPDGTRLATACADNTIRLWDLATRQEVAELRGHEAYVHSVAWSPDGTRLVSGSGDFTVRIWDTRSPRQRAEK